MYDEFSATPAYKRAAKSPRAATRPPTLCVEAAPVNCGGATVGLVGFVPVGIGIGTGEPPVGNGAAMIWKDWSSWPRTTPATKRLVWASVKKPAGFLSICFKLNPAPLSRVSIRGIHTIQRNQRQHTSVCNIVCHPEASCEWSSDL